jgi:tetratricopeptide (TPR) repeat protein
MSREILLALTLLISNGAMAADHSHDGMVEACREAVQNLDRVSSVDLLVNCWDFYWHEGDPQDQVHAYDRIIQLGERIVVLEDEQDTVYGDISWLYWSRWKETKEDPESFPQKSEYLARLQDLVSRGMQVRANLRNFTFCWDTGFTLYLMQKDVPAVVPQMLTLWKQGLAVANLRDPEEKKGAVNISKQLGYYYYKELNDKVTALKHFRYALKLQPDNAGAKKMVAQIERELGGGKKRK